jgi:hypothetical protein
MAKMVSDRISIQPSKRFQFAGRDGELKLGGKKGAYLLHDLFGWRRSLQSWLRAAPSQQLFGDTGNDRVAFQLRQRVGK